MPLKREPNLTKPDEFYAALVALHDGLAPEESARLNFRLLLILMNEIGDDAIIREAMTTAAASGR